MAQIGRHLPSPARAVRARSFPLRAPTTPAGAEPLEGAERTGVGFDTSFSRRWAARLCRAAVVEGPMRAMVRVLADPQREGTDRLSDLEGPLVFASNHHSHLDTPLLLTSIPEPWRHRIVVGAAADYFFGTRLAGTTAALVMGAIPIERARVGRKSADLAASLIDEGWSLLIYPEGGRSPDGWGQQFRGGAAYLSVRCGVPVVPIHVGGTDRILRKGRALPRPAQATVTFGAALHPDHGEKAARFAKRIEKAVTALADEASSDWYSARKRAHAGVSGTLTGPEAGQWRRQWALNSSRRPTASRPISWPNL